MVFRITAMVNALFLPLNPSMDAVAECGVLSSSVNVALHIDHFTKHIVLPDDDFILIRVYIKLIFL